MPLNFDLAGKAYPTSEQEVTADQIAEYAAASSDGNPRYQAGTDQVAPPVFPVVPAFAELGRVTTDPDLGVDNPLMIVHGEQEFRYHRPIRPGDKLTLHPTLERVEDKGRHATFVAKLAMTGAGGEPVVDQYATIFVRGGGSGAERPKSGGEPSGEEISGPREGDDVVSFTRHVDAGMPARYAAASGDHNPIHLDDGVAKMVGLPGVINHGLGTLSLVAGGLVEHLCDGDPARLRRLAVRFTDMVFPGSDVTTAVAAAGDGRHRFETTRPDGTVVMAGEAETA